MLEQQGSRVDVLCSTCKSYPFRLLELYIRLLFLSIKPYDKIFIGFEPQLILPFWGWKLCKKPVTIDFFISVYETFVEDRRKVKQNTLVARMMHWMDTFTFQHANRIIVDTKEDKRYFCENFGRGNEVVDVLYLEADVSLFYPRCSVRPNKLNGRFVVLYFGSILPLQGVEVVLGALEQLKDDPEFYCYMIGPVSKKYPLVIADNIEYISWLPQDVLAEYISYADLCLAGHFHGTIGKAKRTIPGKTYIYQAMGKPVVLGDSAANRELFCESDGEIYFVSMGNANALAEKIMEIKKRAFL